MLLGRSFEVHKVRCDFEARGDARVAFRLQETLQWYGADRSPRAEP